MKTKRTSKKAMSQKRRERKMDISQGAINFSLGLTLWPGFSTDLSSKKFAAQVKGCTSV